MFDSLSNRIAGGQRMSAADLLPQSQDPTEGTVPEEFLMEVNPYDWFDPTVWAKANPDDLTNTDLAAMVGQNDNPGRAGKGMDWFRGGEAPHNLTNRNNPLYQSRREFAVALDRELAKKFGVSAQGSAGHLRGYQASHADPGGPSPNSDHYSGGAIDYFGTKEELDQLHAFLIAQPYTSFVRWQSESHYDHLHVSFDLGWVAEHYFTGKTIPPVIPGSQTAGGAAARNKSYNPLASAPTSSRQPPQAPRQPVRAPGGTGGPQEF